MEIIDANTLFGPSPRMTADVSIKKLVESIKRHNVTAGLTLSTVGIFHNYVDGNAETAEECKGKPELMTVATIDPRGYFGKGQVISNLISQGFRLFRFFPGAQGWPLDHAVFEDIMDELEPVSAPVMVNAGRTGDATALAQIIANKEHPLILEGVTFETLAESVAVMRRHQNIYIETHALTVPGGLRFLVGQIGADRIIFGSDCPRSSLGGALRYVMDSEIPEEDMAKVLGGNIKRLLGG